MKSRWLNDAGWITNNGPYSGWVTDTDEHSPGSGLSSVYTSKKEVFSRPSFHTMKYNDEESYYEKMKQTSTPAPTQGQISDKGKQTYWH